MAHDDQHGGGRPPQSESGLSQLRRSLRHDLRSPLTIIVGRADLLLSEGQGPLTEAQRRSLTAILASAERLDAMLGTVADQLDRVCAEPLAPPDDSATVAARDTEHR